MPITPQFEEHLLRNQQVANMAKVAPTELPKIPDYLGWARKRAGVGKPINLPQVSSTISGNITVPVNRYYKSAGSTTGGTFKNTSNRGPRKGLIPANDWELAKKWGAQYGVDPAVLVAIGMHETRWGKLGAGRQGLHLGVGAYDSGATMKYAGINNQLRVGAKTLKSMGVRNITDIQKGKGRRWATDPAWARGVVSAYKQYTGSSAAGFWRG